MTIVALVTVIAAVALPVTARRPFDRELPEGRDGGAFAYAGWAITQGQTPYRDFWDHKPPGIYYVNALGLTLADGEYIGVRYLETLFVVAALIATWLLAARRFGAVPAGIAVTWMAIFASHPSFLETENLTEIYSSLLSALAFAVLLSSDARRVSPAIAGALLATAFLFKPVALAGAGGCVLLCATAPTDTPRSSVRAVVILLLAFLLVVIAVTIYLIMIGAGPQCWAQVVEYNFVYVDERVNLAVDEHVGKFIGRVGPIHASLGIAIAIVGWAAWSRLARRYRTLQAESGAAIAAGFWLLLATAAAAAPAKYHGHYFLELIPPTGFLLMLALRLLLWACRRRARLCAALVSLGAVVVVAALQYRQYHVPALRIRELKRHDFVAAAISDLRRRRVKPAQFLVWGADPSVYFALRSPAPTRFNYYYAFLHSRYALRHKCADSLLADLEADPPRFIVDLSNFIGRPEFAIHNSQELDETQASRRSVLRPFFDQVAARYEPVDDPPAFGRDASLIPMYHRIPDGLQATSETP